jgi:DNA (cytosine-5)-methyltransferase 1
MCGADDNQAQAGHLIPIGFAWQAGGNACAADGLAADQSPTLTRKQTMAVAISENQRGELLTGDVAQSLTSGGGKPGQGYPAVMTVAVRGRENGAQIEPGGEVANTLRTNGGGSSHAMAFDGAAVRRLTPLECERLMGWPDGWTQDESDASRYRMAGNGVATVVAQWIGKRIMEVS